ncbi:MAG: HDOD domain-containing protein [Planctomycetales bacterium]|nr:HDOD domain-containing protein [Planctomycetales bacterium]
MNQRILFVDDDPFLLQGLRRIVMCACDDWDAEFVSSGEEALLELDGEPFDVVVSDMRMPSMDGAEFLAQVRDRHPEIIRLILSGQSENEAIMRAIGPAHQFLAKPCQLDNLMAAIQRALTLRDKLNDNRLRTIVAGIRSLPSLTGNIQLLMQKLGDPEVSLDEISDIVVKDIGMTTKILQVVNSPYFGISNPIANPRHAIALLGMNQVRPLVLTAGVFAECERLGKWTDVATAVMDHSMAVASRAHHITFVETDDAVLADYAFLAGMLHDVGKLILMQHNSDEYDAALELSKVEGIPQWQAERQILQTCHAEIGAFLLGLWGLPSPTVEAVMCHHTPCEATERGFTVALAVHVADACEIHAQDSAKSFDDFVELDHQLLVEAGVVDRLATWRELTGNTVLTGDGTA